MYVRNSHSFLILSCAVRPTRTRVGLVTLSSCTSKYCFSWSQLHLIITITITVSTTITAIFLHPVFRPQTRSQPCSIDAGGNIFLHGGGVNVRNQDDARTNAADGNRPPLAGGGESKQKKYISTTVLRRRKCRASGALKTGTSGNGGDSRIDTAGGHWVDSKLDTAGSGCQGANVLRHAGGILRCRSVYASSRTPVGSSSSVANIIDTAVSEPVKPKLRAYSAPQFLHSTSFLPTSPTHSTCRKMPTMGMDNSRSRRYQTLTTGADDGHRKNQTSVTAADHGRTSRRYQTPATRGGYGRTSRRYQTPSASGGSCGCRAQTSHGDTHRQVINNTSAVAVATAAVAGAGAGAGAEAAESGAEWAPCRHRRAGYLHRYMGFVQERVSSPPLESFRALGGLGEYPRKESSAAAVRRTSIDQDGAASANSTTEEAVTSDPRGRRCSLGTSAERSYGGRFSTAAAMGGPSSTAVSSKEARPLELFTDGIRLAPNSKPNAAQIIPAWCSRSKKRPKGAKRQKSWEAGGRRSCHPKDAPKNNPPGSSSLKACKAKTRRNRRAGSPYLVGVLLPYDLERPVSPERTEAFRYTCN